MKTREYRLAVLLLFAASAGCQGQAPQPPQKPSVLTLEDAARRLGEISGSEVREYSTYDFGRARDPNARSVVVPIEMASQFVDRMRAELGPNLLAFVGTTRWLGDEEHEGVEVVVAKGESQFDILRVARSDGINYGLETEDVVEKLRQYDEAFGIDIVHAETDTIQFLLVSMPDDLPGFCRDLYEFCPDIVDQGTGTVERLETEIRTTRQVYLWWD